MNSAAKWIIAGTAGGAFGALVWAAISHFASLEAGIVAWGIGALVGFAVGQAAADDASAVSGIGAALIAILAVAGGKYAAVAWDLQAATQQVTQAEITDHDLMVLVSDEVVEEFEERSTPMKWPEGMTVDEAEEEADYPKNVWAEATQRVSAMTEADREQRKQEMRDEQAEALRQFRKEFQYQAFIGSFGFFDALWLFLAVGSAFRLGAGSDKG